MQRIDRYVVHLSVLDRTQRSAGISDALGKSAGEPQAQKPSLIAFPVPLRASADSTFAGWLAYRQRCNPRCEFAALPEKAPNGRGREIDGSRDVSAQGLQTVERTKVFPRAEWAKASAGPDGLIGNKQSFRPTYQVSAALRLGSQLPSATLRSIASVLRLSSSASCSLVRIEVGVSTSSTALVSSSLSCRSRRTTSPVCRQRRAEARYEGLRACGRQCFSFSYLHWLTTLDTTT